MTGGGRIQAEKARAAHVQCPEMRQCGAGPGPPSSGSQSLSRPRTRNTRDKCDVSARISAELKVSVYFSEKLSSLLPARSNV